MIDTSLCKRIKSIQFGLFSPEEIKRGSVCNVLHPETLENGIPKEGGLIDIRMGTTEKSFVCQTCNNTMYECVGHFGHIELCKPMFHVGYTNKIKKLLECVCFYCSRLLQSHQKGNGGKLETMWSSLKNKTICDGTDENGQRVGCMNRQPVIKKEGMNLMAFLKGNDEEGKVLLSGEKIYAILKKISFEDCKELGFDGEFCKPEYMLTTVVLVAPPCMRPSILTDGLRSEDDLTHKYADIVKANSCLRKYEQEGAPSHIVRDYEQLLQFHLSTLINNEMSGQPTALQKSGRPLKSISARLKGKEGRVRGNLMGKRVDFSARSVITPDSNIELDEVGIPIEIAKIHTFPEKVNKANKNFLQKLVNNGPLEYPGANYVVRSDGQRIDLKFNRFDLKLEKSFVVERHILNNDIVLFNRQPSLHKMSMMGHRAKVMGNKTFRLNLSVTSPYNADFDGDEMNLHMPQSYPAKAELEILAAVSNQIISPQSNKPVIGIVQDTLVGLRLLTLKDSFFRRRELMCVLYASNAEDKKIKLILHNPCILSPVKLWSGKQVISAVLPGIFYRGKVNGAEDYTNRGDINVLVRDGMLLTGILDKKSCGAQQNGIIHIISNDFGYKTAQSFLNATQRVVNYFITQISSFSIGIGDIVVNERSACLCREKVTNAMKAVDAFIEQAREGQLEKMPGLNIEETFESKINNVLNKARDFQSNTASNMKTMVLAGSKGSTINISQVSSCVGQQNVEGKRIGFGFEQRTLPHFLKYDYSAKSRGFVSNSYMSGMDPYEFYFHAMGGREGLIDTAIKTAETGYIQRRLVKAMEDAVVNQDGSVRNCFGMIYQYEYGDDGYDAKKLENINNPWYEMTGDKIKNKFYDHFLIDMFVDTKYSISPQQVAPSVFEILKNDFELQKKLDEEFEYLEKNRSIYKTYSSPVNIMRIIEGVRNNYNVGNNYNVEINAKQTNNINNAKQTNNINNAKQTNIINNAKQTNNINNAKQTNNINNAKQTNIINNANNITNEEVLSPYLILETISSLMTHNLFLNFYIRSSLAVKPTLLSLSRSQFMQVVQQIKMKCLCARVNANEMVGTLAAQSVGEPATQMTLNTFHLAGVASTVTMGVPRLNEIINVARKIKTPSVVIKLNNKSIVNAGLVRNSIEYVRVKDLFRSSKILYEADLHSQDDPADQQLVQSYFEFPDEGIDYDALGKFTIRLHLDRYSLISRNISVDQIAEKLQQAYRKKLFIISSDQNDPQQILRIKFYTEEENVDFYREEEQKILNMHIQGYEGIKKAYIVTDKLSGENCWGLQTDGVNFLPLLSHDEIDGSGTTVNDLYVVCSTLGIEAARQTILNELVAVIENNGSYVNNRHLSLLSDVMTSCGFLTGITRHGVNKAVKAGALKRASFEETVDILLEAAVDAENDFSNGITENVMMGQIAPMGTGIVKLILDTKKLSSSFITADISAKTSAGENDLMNSPAYSDLSNSQISTVLSPYLSESVQFSPEYDLQFSPEYKIPTEKGFSPASASYSPTSAFYSPTSAAYSPTSNLYSPTSNLYSPNTVMYSPNSGENYSPTSASYSPSSNSYSPSSNQYTPGTAKYSPKSPSESSQSPKYGK
ncbi:hypothetical protein NUSPORA_01366 [Nucleospora cyclopteri]